MSTIAVTSSPVNVLAGALGLIVSIRQVDGETAVPFKIYDANGNLLTTIQAGQIYAFNAGPTPFYDGQVVGQISVATGTSHFVVDDIDRLPSWQAQNGVTVMSADGAIPIKQGTVMITKASAAALTLALPIPGSGPNGDDGKTLEIVDTTGQAHTVTTPTNGLNGADHVATYGGAVPDNIRLKAYSGVWYVQGSVGITLS